MLNSLITLVWNQHKDCDTQAQWSLNGEHDDDHPIQVLLSNFALSLLAVLHNLCVLSSVDTDQVHEDSVPQDTSLGHEIVDTEWNDTFSKFNPTLKSMHICMGKFNNEFSSRVTSKIDIHDFPLLECLLTIQARGLNIGKTTGALSLYDYTVGWKCITLSDSYYVTGYQGAWSHFYRLRERLGDQLSVGLTIVPPSPYVLDAFSGHWHSKYKDQWSYRVPATPWTDLRNWRNDGDDQKVDVSSTSELQQKAIREEVPESIFGRSDVIVVSSPLVVQCLHA